jgi:hypothetical protein
MSVASRPVSTGKTRTCPHCKATILESLSICPGCMHHLRFDSEAAKRQVAAAPALRVEGIIRHPPLEQPLEYFVIIAIRNDRGEEVTRQVVNVGALQAAEKRTFTLSVEVLPPQAPVPPTKSNTSTAALKSPIQQPAATVRPATPPAATSPPASASPSTSAPAGTSAQTSTSTPPASAPQARPAQGATPTPQAPKPGSNASSAATGGLKPPTPGSNAPRAPTTSTNPAGPANPANPASPAKPTSGYVLKPPSPGGPKRH